MSKTNELKRRWARWRDKLRDRPAADFTYRIVVGVIGLVVLVAGILAIPYPGPGWAIVFIGLAILATEFEWAHRLLRYTREPLRPRDGLVQAAGHCGCRPLASRSPPRWCSARCGCLGRSGGPRHWWASTPRR